MEAEGLVSAGTGGKPREVLVGREVLRGSGCTAPVDARALRWPRPPSGCRCARPPRLRPRASATSRRIERDGKVRAQLTSTTDKTASPDLLAELRQTITAFELVVRRFPTSGYADNALFQAASLADAAYEKFGRAEDRERASRFYRWLVQEYPQSSLVRRAKREARSRGDAGGHRTGNAHRHPAHGDGRIRKGNARARSGGRVCRAAARRAGTRVFRFTERATDAGVARHRADVSQRRGQQDPHRPPSRSRGARRARSRRRRQVQRVHAVQPVPPRHRC